jgi:hypothetical protein
VVQWKYCFGAFVWALAPFLDYSWLYFAYYSGGGEQAPVCVWMCVGVCVRVCVDLDFKLAHKSIIYTHDVFVATLKPSYIEFY